MKYTAPKNTAHKTSTSPQSTCHPEQADLSEQNSFNHFYLNLSKEKFIEFNRAVIVGLLKAIEELKQENEMLKTKLSTLSVIVVLVRLDCFNLFQ